MGARTTPKINKNSINIGEFLKTIPQQSNPISPSQASINHRRANSKSMLQSYDCYRMT